MRLTASNIYIQSLLPPGTRLTRDVLDRLSADPEDDEFGTGTTRPIVVRDSGGHEFSTNSQAIINAGIDENTATPPGSFIGRDENGVPNGLFGDFSANWGPTPPSPPDSTYLARVGNVQEATRKGITSYLRPNGSPADLAVWQRVADDGLLTVRLGQALGAGALRGEDDPTAIASIIDGLNAARAQYDGYTSPASPGEIHVDTVKIFCDGVAEFPTQTAAFIEPYNVNMGTEENPIWEPGTNYGEDPSCEDATAGFVALDANRGRSTSTRSGTDRRGSRWTTSGRRGRRNGQWDSRHTITHLEFVTRRT